MRLLVGLTACAILVGCDREDRKAEPSAQRAILVEATQPAPVRDEPSKLDQIFDPDMLGAQVAYLESVAGPAWRVDDHGGGTEIRHYKVASCVADITVKGGAVIALGMDVSPQCTFAVQPFAPNQRLPTANQMKFGDLGGTTYTADCLRSCGNAADPWVYADWTGSHADNFVEIRIGAPQVSDAALDAAETWEEAMIAAKGEDWVTFGDFRCSTAFNHVATRAFKAVPVQRVQVGALAREAPVCEGG